MPADAPVTRERLRRELVANAALKPLNLAALFGLLAAGFVAGVPLIGAVVALVVYAVLFGQTFLDPGEAERVGKQVYSERRPARAALDPATLPSAIGEPLRVAREQAAAIRAAIAAEPGVALDDVAGDVDALVAAMETSAGRAARIHATLADLDAAGSHPEQLRRRIAGLAPRAGDPDVAALISDLEAQLAATERLRDKLERFEVGQQRIVSALAVLRARIADMGATEEAATQRELVDTARDLRQRTDLLAESLAEAYGAAEGLGGSAGGGDATTRSA